MKKIAKFNLALNHGSIVYRIPRTARVLHIGQHMSELYMWVEMDDASTIFINIKFVTIHDGEEVPAGGRYEGTCILSGTQKICHVYAVEAEE